MRLGKTLGKGLFVALLLISLATVAIAIEWDGVPDDPTPSQAVWVDPKNTPCLSVGQTFIVDVLINITSPTSPGGTGLFGWQYTLGWDTSVIDTDEASSTTHVLPGTGFQVANDWTVPGRHVYSWTLFPPSTAFTGVTSLCTYEFTVMGSGGSALDLSETEFTDDTATIIISDTIPVGTTVDGMYCTAPPEPPVAVFTFSPPAPVVGETVTFDASGSSDPDGTIVSWDWDFGDGSTDSGEIVTYAYAAAGDYTVTLVVTDNDGLTDTATDVVTVSEVVLEPPVAVFTFSPTVPLVGETVTFDASGSYDPDGTIVSYDWDFGDATTGTGVNPTHAYAAAGTYTVTLTVTDDDGLTDTATDDITVSEVPVPQPPVAVFTFSPTVPLVGETVTFDASGSYDPDGTIVSYDWDFGDATTGTGVNPTHAYAAAGTYTVTLTVTDDDGLTDTATDDITVSEVPPPQATIESCDSMGVRKDTFDLDETVYVNGSGYAPSTVAVFTYDIYVVDDVTWSDGMAIPERVPGTATTVSSDILGNVPPTPVWSDPLTPGKYDIVVDVNNNSVYDEGIDALDDMDIQETAGFFVIPEYVLGTIVGLVACFAAFGLLFRSKRLRRGKVP